MQIVIPMAGQGYRFLREGYQDPKPLIPVDGQPIIKHIVGLFPGEHDFVFICNDEHLAKTNMREILSGVKPSAKIVEIPAHHLGPVHTVLAAKDYISDDLPTIITYCDIFLHWDFDHFTKSVSENNYDAVLVVFKGFHPPLSRDGFYASVRTGKDGLAEEVREKASFTENKMDSWNSAGVHYFKAGKLIKKYFQEMKDHEMMVNNEYYVSISHNLLIRDGLKNGIYPVEYFISWGKPMDLREYQYWSNHFNNHPNEN